MQKHDRGDLGAVTILRITSWAVLVLGIIAFFVFAVLGSRVSMHTVVGGDGSVLCVGSECPEESEFEAILETTESDWSWGNITGGIFLLVSALILWALLRVLASIASNLIDIRRALTGAGFPDAGDDADG